MLQIRHMLKHIKQERYQYIHVVYVGQVVFPLGTDMHTSDKQMVFEQGVAVFFFMSVSIRLMRECLATDSTSKLLWHTVR